MLPGASSDAAARAALLFLRLNDALNDVVLDATPACVRDDDG